MVTGVLPVLKMVTSSSPIAPTGTPPNDTLLGETVADVKAFVPFPLATSESTGAFDASLVNVTTPLTPPGICGENAIVVTTLVPAGRVIGNVGVKIENPFPVTVATEIVTLPVPLLASVMSSVCVDPMPTFPKYAVDGVIVRIPDDVEVLDPVPVTVSVVVELLAFEVKETLPVTVPLTCGWKVRVIGSDEPGGMDIGNCVAGTVNSVLSTLALEMFRLAALLGPVFDT